MIVSRLRLKNWRNFKRVDIPLRERQFVVGPNASGKSNLLDLLRFLRDVATTDGGGLQKAVQERGGVSKIRCLAARTDSEILVDVELAKAADQKPVWRYLLGFKQETRGYRRTLVTQEKVWRSGELILERPSADDLQDEHRLTQTHLEQINVNRDFRDVASRFQSVTYLHLVPQLLRYADRIQGRIVELDPFGQGFLERIARCPEKVRKTRLATVEEALKVAVPQLASLEFVRDAISGRPHLRALYRHWRPRSGWQREDQFSDGTLRLIALVWSLLETDSILLLEEPELSLNAGVVMELAPLIHKMQRLRSRQIIVSTHSADLLTDGGIDGREVLLLAPGQEGTESHVASTIEEVQTLLEAGLTVAEAVLPRTKPSDVHRLGESK